MHDVLRPLAGLVGTWTGRGHGEYPTIEPFDYDETVTFGHVGKPFLSYAQRTSHPATGQPLHAESGWLRLPGDDLVELVVAQPTGIVEVHGGRMVVEGDQVTLTLAANTVATTPSAVAVEGVQRTFVLAGDELRYDLAMEAVGQPLTHHLAAVLRRQH